MVIFDLRIEGSFSSQMTIFVHSQPDGIGSDVLAVYCVLIDMHGANNALWLFVVDMQTEASCPAGGSNL